MMVARDDGGEADEKIIAVPVEDPRFDKVQDLEDINPHTRKEIEHFFGTYKKLQEKAVEIHGYEGKLVAQASFDEGLELYRQKYSKQS